MSSTEQERAVGKILFGVQEVHSGLQRLKGLGPDKGRFELSDLSAAEEALETLREKLRAVLDFEL